MVFRGDILYMIGGRDSNMEKSRRCACLNLENFEWTTLPDLNLKRCGSGAFVAPDGYLYVFAGNKKHKSQVERLKLAENGKNWEIIEFENGNYLNGKSYISYGIWNFKTQEDEADKNMVFCFSFDGDICVLDFENHKFKSYRETFEKYCDFAESDEVEAFPIIQMDDQSLIITGKKFLHKIDVFEQKYERYDINP